VTAQVRDRDLRAVTQRLIAREVLLHGPMPRIELARRLRLSPASLTRLTKPLIDSGVFVESAATFDGRNGRPAQPLDVATGLRHFVGVELRHDGIHGALTNWRAELVAAAHVQPTDLEPDTVVTAIAALVTALSDRVPAAGGPVVGLGISIGGLVPDQDVVVRAPFLRWAAPVALGSLLREATGLPTVVDNDLLALAKAEHWFGVAKGCSHFALITIGVGVGYALVVHGQTVETPDAGVGIIGHFPLDRYGPACEAGHRGCAQAFLSSTNIAARASAGRARAVTYDEALDLAAAGDGPASTIVSESAQALGRLVAAAAGLTMTPTVVLSGEGVRLAEIGWSAFNSALNADREAFASTLDLRITAIDYDKWARGAATAAIQAYMQ
jgi:predicted NBD/HSP70 family sugar kinase